MAEPTRDRHRRFKQLLLLPVMLNIAIISSAGSSPQRSLAVVDTTLQYQTSFRQNFNTYLWQLKFFYDKSFQNIDLKVTENFSSSLLKIGSDNNKWNDDNTAEVELTYHISPSWAIYNVNYATRFSDRQSGLVNDISTQAGLVGLNFNSRQRAYLSPAVGWKVDTRFQQKDEGVTYRLTGLLNEYEVNGYYNSLNLLLDGDRIGERDNRSTSFMYSLYKEFYEQTSDTIMIVSNSRRRDNYISSAEEIETYIENANSIFHSLRYLISDEIYIAMHNKLSQREVKVSHRFYEARNRVPHTPYTAQIEETDASDTDERRKRTDFRTENDFSILWNNSYIKGELGAAYWAQEQNYDMPGAAKNLPFSFRTSFVAQDYQSFEVGAFAKVGWQILKSDSLGFEANVRKLQYDTPDTSNFDDRDEFKFKLNISEVHIFSPFLRMQVNAGVSLYHYVYIFSERSADNNWTRVFRLSPELIYRPAAGIDLRQRFEVLAKYVDFDYEFESRDVSSFVYRKFTSESNFKYHIVRATWLNLGYRLELEENGTLVWERWVERPLFVRNNSWFRASLGYKPSDRFELSPGISLYARDEWRYALRRSGNAQKEKASELLSVGPYLTIFYQPSQSLLFSLSASRQRISSPDQATYAISAIDILLNWAF